MFVVDDIINAGVGIFGKIWATRMIQREIEKWVKFWSGQFFTFFVSFNVVCGGVLVASGNVYAIAIGSGQIVASARCIWAWQKSKVTEDIIVALPNDTFVEASAGSQTINNTVLTGKNGN